MSIITKDIWGWWWPKWQRCHFRSTSGLNLSKAGALADVTNLKSNWWWLIGVEMMIFLMKLQFLAILIFPNWQDLNLRDHSNRKFPEIELKTQRLLPFPDNDANIRDFVPLLMKKKYLHEFDDQGFQSKICEQFEMLSTVLRSFSRNSPR